MKKLPFVLAGAICTVALVLPVTAGLAASLSSPVQTPPAPTSFVLAGPSSSTVGSQLYLFALLKSTGTEPDGVGVVTVTCTEGGQTTTVPNVYASTGVDFAVPDSPPATGTATYRWSYPGDATHRASSASISVHIIKNDSALEINQDVVNGSAIVTATLDAGHTNRNVTITATPQGSHHSTVVASGPVNALGYLSVTTPLPTQTTFTATYSGDAWFSSASATTTVTPWRAPNPPSSRPPLNQRATIAVQNMTYDQVSVTLADDANLITTQLNGRQDSQPFDYETRNSVPYDGEGVSVKVLSGIDVGVDQTDDYFAPGHSYLVQVIYEPFTSTYSPANGGTYIYYDVIQVS